MKIFIITILVLICHQIQAQGTLTFDNENFRFVLKVDTIDSSDGHTCTVAEIEIYKQKDRALVQTIEPPGNEHSCGFPKQQIFIIEDMNFDGQDDFRLFEFLPAAPNIPYLYWFYDSKTVQFKYDTTLAEVTSPEFDKDNKVISSFWRNGCCEHGRDFYRYDKAALILYERRIIGHDENDKEYAEIWKLENGVLTKQKE
jgi:hypothetical protein